MISPIKLGWMAGVIDLKGRLLRKRNKMRATPQIVLAVQTKELAVIRELGNLTGTKPEAIQKQPIKDFMRRSCAEHCPEAHVHYYSDVDGLYMPEMRRWTVTGAAMYVVLDNLLPYIQIDRGYTEAMEKVMGNTSLVGQGATAVIVSLRRLYSLGWELPDEFKGVVDDATAGQA